MIRPPFTILILKNTHQPVTMRITALSLVVFFTVIPALSCVTGIGLTILAHRSFSGKQSVSSDRPNPGGIQPVLNNQSSGESKESSGAGIDGLFVSRQAGDIMEISFNPSNLPESEVCYIWIVLNPDGGSGEMIIHPRSPVFRGVPVDYRNGLTFLASQERKFTASLDGIPKNLPIVRIRILIYSSEGRVLADKRFEIGQDARM
jgi:hypothetical protein